MLRHVFIINVKEGISDDIVEQKVLEMRSMKEKIKVIDTIIAGRTRGLFGRPDAVMMVVDFKDKNAFDEFINHPVHVDISERAAEAFDVQSIDVAQIEYDNF